MSLTLGILGLFVAIQAVVVAYVYGWLVQVEARDEAGKAAELVIAYQKSAKITAETLKPLQDELKLKRRGLFALFYDQPWWLRWWWRLTGRYGPKVRATFDEIHDLKVRIRDMEADLDHYYLVARGELRRLRVQLPELAERLEKLLP